MFWKTGISHGAEILFSNQLWYMGSEEPLLIAQRGLGSSSLLKLIQGQKMG